MWVIRSATDFWSADKFQNQQLGDACETPRYRYFSRRNGRVSRRRKNFLLLREYSNTYSWNLTPRSTGNRSLAIYDLRFPGPTPLLSLSGHFNSFTRDVGLDILNQEFVAVG